MENAPYIWSTSAICYPPLLLMTNESHDNIIQAQAITTDSAKSTSVYHETDDGRTSIVTALTVTASVPATKLVLYGTHQVGSSSR